MPIRRLDDEELARRIGPAAEEPSYVRHDSCSDDEIMESYKPRIPPKFCKPLKNLQLVEGSKAVLECTVTPQNDPTMVIEWFKDGVEILQGSRIKLALNEFGFCVLEFIDVWPRDAGVYTCKATNSCGVDSIGCSISVMRTTELDNESQLPEDMQAGYQEMYYFETLKGMKDIDDNDEDQERPIIVQAPDVVDVVEGQGAKFICRVHGNPTPKLHWYKNDEILMESRRVNVWFDGIHHLEFPRTRFYDGGNITVIARNVHGEVRHDTQLIVREKPNATSNLRHVQRSFTDTEVKKMKSGRASTEEETPELKEAFRKARVQRPDDHRLNHLDDKPIDYPFEKLKAILSLKNREEVPEYASRMREVRKLDPTNTGQQVSMMPDYAEITPIDPSTGMPIQGQGQPGFDPQQGQFDQSGNVVPQQGLSHEGSRGNRSSSAGPPVPDGTKPQFLQPFSDLSCFEGDSSSFQCQVTGSEPMSARWFKENMEIRQNTPGFQVTAQNGILTLTVKKATTSFSGRYMCALKNKFGDESLHARLTVQRRGGTAQPAKPPQAPNFASHLPPPGAKMPPQNPAAFETSGQAPGQIPGQAPGQMPGQARGQIPGQAPGQVPGQAPRQMPGQAPGQMPGQALGQMPGRNPGQMSGQAPGQIPGQVPGQRPSQRPQQFPGQVSSQAPGPNYDPTYSQPQANGTINEPVNQMNQNFASMPMPSQNNQQGGPGMPQNANYSQPPQPNSNTKQPQYGQQPQSQQPKNQTSYGPNSQTQNRSLPSNQTRMPGNQQGYPGSQPNNPSNQQNYQNNPQQGYQGPQPGYPGYMPPQTNQSNPDKHQVPEPAPVQFKSQASLPSQPLQQNLPAAPNNPGMNPQGNYQHPGYASNGPQQSGPYHTPPNAGMHPSAQTAVPGQPGFQQATPGPVAPNSSAPGYPGQPQQGSKNGSNATMTPSFVRGLKDMTLKVGEFLILDVEVAGNPSPKISFFMNSTQLKPTNRVKIDGSGNKRKVVISGARVSDSGLYECRIGNNAGSDISQARITVQPPPGQNKPFNPPGQFNAAPVNTAMGQPQMGGQSGGYGDQNQYVDNQQYNQTPMQQQYPQQQQISQPQMIPQQGGFGQQPGYQNQQPVPQNNYVSQAPTQYGHPSQAQPQQQQKPLQQGLNPPYGSPPKQQPTPSYGQNEPMGLQQQGQPMGMQIQNQPLSMQNQNQPMGAQNQNQPMAMQNQNQPMRMQNQNQPMGMQNQNQPMGMQNQHQPMGMQNQNQPMRMQQPMNQPMGMQYQNQPMRMQQPINQPMGTQAQNQPMGMQLQNQPMGMQHQNQPMGMQYQNQPMQMQMGNNQNYYGMNL
ncbi:titin-like isoform X2 [Symsagittifera roscoffensis]|uniref:titin-like isoform X2 n=1 Tax=Symsagittifera roscoffensis TaxID=84072 RepID=UPI00307C3E65